MATTTPAIQVQAASNNAFSKIWERAIEGFEELSLEKIDHLPKANNVDEILVHVRERESKFKLYRHDGSKVDKFRTLVSKSLDPVDKIGNMVATAATVVWLYSMTSFKMNAYVYVLEVISPKHGHFHGCPLSYYCMISSMSE